MGTRVELLTPVGRLVQGSVYTGSTTDIENKPLIYKSGANIGQPRTNFWFNVAIQKVTPHWNQTDWGKKIYDVAVAAFPKGDYNRPDFAWKIIDGDSTIPNKQGNRPCDNEGFPGHWVLKFSGSFAPGLYNETGSLPLTEPNAIQLGDYIEVYGFVEDNGLSQTSGVYLNHKMVARSGFGTRIVLGADPKSVGFGNSALPPGASTTPIAQAFAPAPVPSYAPPVAAAPNAAYIPPTSMAPVPPQYPAILTPAAPVPAYVPPVAASPVPPPAYTAILTPPPPASTRVMSPACNGATYEQLIAAGWTDQTLIANGMMTV